MTILTSAEPDFVCRSPSEPFIIINIVQLISVVDRLLPTYDFRSTARRHAFRCAGLRYPVHAVPGEANPEFEYLLLLVHWRHRASNVAAAWFASDYSTRLRYDPQLYLVRGIIGLQSAEGQRQTVCRP